MSKSNMFKLQKVQNSAARLIVRKSKRQSMTGIMKELHWLNIESRIIFKILLLVYKCINGKCSKNLRITYNYGYHNCRPIDCLLLATKKVNTKYGKRTFDYVSPRLWNALPLHVRVEEKIETFKRQVKTILFNDTVDFKRRAFKYD